mgnify:CR=1
MTAQNDTSTPALPQSGDQTGSLSRNFSLMASGTCHVLAGAFAVNVTEIEHGITMFDLGSNGLKPEQVPAY